MVRGEDFCDTVTLDDENSELVIIDQTLLPNELKLLRLSSQEEIWRAIYLLQVRGAPAIGVAAAFGLYLAAKGIETEDYDDFVKKFRAANYQQRGVSVILIQVYKNTPHKKISRHSR